MNTRPWFVYMILTSNQSFYTGITTDIERRFKEHLAVSNKIKNAKGAKYFNSTKPEKVVYQEQFDNRSEASKKECTIKKMTKQEKERLVHQTIK